MASTEAVALISSSSAVLGGLIGAAAGHFTTIRSQTLQAEQEHSGRRLAAYQDFLARCHEFMQAAGNIEPKDNAAWAVWFREFEVSLTTVLLLGKHKPRKAAVSLRGCIEDILRTTAAASGDTAQKRRQAAYLKHEKELINAYDKAVAAMRSDVGVDA